MPRRRMIDPSLTDDIEVAQLTRDERLFLVGCLRNADDEGRLRGHRAFLKAGIFMYDDDITLARMEEIKNSTLEKMGSWRPDNIWHLRLYQNRGIDYLYFPLWYSWQAPSHPQPSQLPTPPDVTSALEVPFTEKDRRAIYERDNWTCQYCGADLANNPRTQTIDHVIPLTLGGSHHHSNLVTACKSCNLKKRNRRPEDAGMALLPTCKVNPEVKVMAKPEVEHNVNQPLSQVRSGQSSQGKGSIGQVREIKEDFTKYLDSEKDLTDFLMTTLTKNISAGRAQGLAAEGGRELPAEIEATVRMNWGIPVLKKCWEDGVGEKIPNAIFDGARKALKQYPLEVVGKAFAKGVRYKGGKHKSWKYIQTIIDEEVEKRGCSPSH